MIKVATYSTRETADEAVSILKRNGIRAEIFNATSNVSSVMPAYRDIVGQYVVLTEEEKQQKASDLLSKISSKSKAASELGREATGAMLPYLLLFVVLAVSLSLAFDPNPVTILLVPIFGSIFAAAGIEGWKQSKKNADR